MKVIRLICVDCGLGRSAFTKNCPRCANGVALPTKFDVIPTKKVSK